jgi:hypothetical protein
MTINTRDWNFSSTNSYKIEMRLEFKKRNEEEEGQQEKKKRGEHEDTNDDDSPLQQTEC